MRSGGEGGKEQWGFNRGEGLAKRGKDWGRGGNWLGGGLVDLLTLSFPRCLSISLTGEIVCIKESNCPRGDSGKGQGNGRRRGES